MSIANTQRPPITSPSDSMVPSLEELPLLSTPAQVTKFTGIPTATLAFWRFEGSHLLFVKMGRLIRYRRQDVLDFVNGNIYTSTTEAKVA